MKVAKKKEEGGGGLALLWMESRGSLSLVPLTSPFFLSHITLYPGEGRGEERKAWI